MILLAISTSGPIASAALLQNGALLCVMRGEPGLTHSETIMPLCDRLLHEQQLTIRDIDVFAADIGPGSFTGVRIGVCAVNALTYAQNKPAVGVSALAALAFGLPGRICALLDCKNGNGYAALYEDGRELIPPGAVVIDELLASLDSPICFVGDHALHRERILAAIPDATFIGDGILTADAVAAAAYEQYNRFGGTKDILPAYIRPSQAERLYKERPHE